MGINKLVREGMGIFLYTTMETGREWEYGHGREWDRKSFPHIFTPIPPAPCLTLLLLILSVRAPLSCSHVLNFNVPDLIVHKRTQ